MDSNQSVRSITWQAPEHQHVEKSGDWYWALGILAVCSAAASFFFGNFLLAILILVGAFAIALVVTKEPKVIEFSVGTRGIKIGDKNHSYSTLESYYIDEVSRPEPQLLLKGKSLYALLIVIPIPADHIDEIEDLLLERLVEEEMEEPFAHKVLEIFGF